MGVVFFEVALEGGVQSWLPLESVGHHVLFLGERSLAEVTGLTNAFDVSSPSFFSPYTLYHPSNLFTLILVFLHVVLFLPSRLLTQSYKTMISHPTFCLLLFPSTFSDQER